MNREYIESICISVYHERRRERAAERQRQQKRRRELMVSTDSPAGMD